MKGSFSQVGNTVRHVLACGALALLLVVGSCGNEAGTGTPAAPTAQISTSDTSETSKVPGPVTPVRVFNGLTFTMPVFLTSVPGPEERLAVVEQEGRIKIFPNRENVSQAEILLDISDKVKSGGEEGMLGLAFDPAFEENGYFYVYYSAGDPRRSVISRFTISSGNPNAADADSEHVILEVGQPTLFGNHKAGAIAFGRDGKLYIALGDGGGAGDPFGNAQNLSKLLGKILRIDPAAGDPYGVPPDNPFVDVAGASSEIWAYGFRNPYRFSFDRLTGQLWAGDVGERDREEIDLVTKGSNHGWSYFEGTLQFKELDGHSPGEFQAPVIEYGRDQGRSVIGGYVYHGSLAPSLRDSYIYADYYSGRMWALGYRDNQVVFNSLIANVPSVSSFGEDRNGELYAVSHQEGQIFQLREQR